MLSDKTFNKKISDILRNRSRNRSQRQGKDYVFQERREGCLKFRVKILLRIEKFLLNLHCCNN